MQNSTFLNLFAILWHLMEWFISLLFAKWCCQTQASTYYWHCTNLPNPLKCTFKIFGDAVFMAGYLINKMPSSSVSNKGPHFILFPYEPLFHILPHVFGSTCFVHDLSPSLEKLKACAFKWIFFYYSCMQKGYCCYSPLTIAFTCLLMSPSMKIHHFFTHPSPSSLSPKYYIFFSSSLNNQFHCHSSSHKKLLLT